MGNMVRPVNSKSVGLLPHFICCEMSSLIGTNAMWNTMMMGKVFCKTMDGNFGRSMWTEKENPYLIVYSNNQVDYSKSWLLGEFPLTVALQDCHRVGL